MLAAIFFDRDGVIIENQPEYVRCWADVFILPDALEALVKFSQSKYKLIMVTNQSVVGRGIISITTAWEINRRLLKVMRAAGARVDGIYMCPHAPDEQCSCRKPNPGLLLQASSDLAIDLSKSMMIGDAWTDLLAGQAAGISTNILVCTGRGDQQNLSPVPPEISSFLVFDTLIDTTSYILGLESG
jgi:D-glycero-D-manno-heptose 1,7-bisphosphate phosphatase